LSFNDSRKDLTRELDMAEQEIKELYEIIKEQDELIERLYQDLDGLEAVKNLLDSHREAASNVKPKDTKQ
jgi:SMC interacting uncharacterized protein involved in chromosome segregation